MEVIKCLRRAEVKELFFKKKSHKNKPSHLSHYGIYVFYGAALTGVLGLAGLGGSFLYLGMIAPAIYTLSILVLLIPCTMYVAWDASKNQHTRVSKSQKSVAQVTNERIMTTPAY